ncbi:MAG: hypothetical protein M3Q27_08940 [Actinomycetota bacterium]|nr:hypothetical protein [Actinomycetota bacterium]
MSESQGFPAAGGAAANAGAATGAARDATQGTPGAVPGTAATGQSSVDSPADMTGRHMHQAGTSSEADAALEAEDGSGA